MYMLKIIILFVIIIILGYISYEYIYNIKTSNTNYPCNQDLTDDEYINHMITHHEVAVYMSEKHLYNTKNPIIFDILMFILLIKNYVYQYL